MNLATRLQLTPNLPEATIRAQGQETEDNFNLVMRHYTFTYLFNQLVSRVGILDFNSQRKLINDIKEDNSINSTLTKMDEAFKVLFGYFKIEEKTYLSYLKDENGYRFKVHINEHLSVERINMDALPLDQMRIIKDDARLANVTVDVNGSPRSYSLIQTAMANRCVFDEKPKFYPEVESFNNFQ